MDILSMLLGQGSSLEKMASSAGVSEKQVAEFTQLGLPTLLEALNRNTKSEAGKESLNEALSQHNEDISDIDSFLNRDKEDSNKMLNHIFSDNRSNVEKNLSKNTGMSQEQTKKMLMVLAPIALAYLAKQKNKKEAEKPENIDINQLIGSEKQSISKVGGNSIFDAAKNLIDKDGDGSIINDIGGILGKFL